MREKVKVMVQVESDSEIGALRKALAELQDEHGDHQMESVDIVSSKPRGSYVVKLESDWFGSY